MTAARSASLIVGLAAISAVVRPQPMHKADNRSMTQTLMQGAEISMSTSFQLGGRMPNEKSAPGRDLAHLLGGAGDVAGLPADRAAGERNHGQSAGRHQRRDERVGQAQRDEAERERNDESRCPGGGEGARIAARPRPPRRRRAPAGEARAA